MTGQQVLDKWIAFYRKYVVMSEAQALAVALWAINTWLYENFTAVPFLEIAATTKRSGKTTLLDCLKLTTRGAEKFAIVRILTVLRMIEAMEGKITILIDEAEQFSKPSLGEIRSGVATGHKAGAQHAISVGKGFQRFRTFAPWAFSQIGNVHDVLRDRCIEIELQRGKPTAMLSENEHIAKAEAEELIADLVTFWRDNVKRLAVVPADWLSGREREIWTPLVSIAHAMHLHTDTMHALQAASVDLGLLKLLPGKKWHSAQDEQDADGADAAERVLRDIQTVIAEGETVIFSRVLVERLRAIPTAPWRGWNMHGLNETTLATLLSRYGVKTLTVAIGKGRKARVTGMGYKIAELRRAK